MLADVTVAIFYFVTFTASLFVILGASFLGYLELTGYFEERKQERLDAEEYRRESD